ncbi:uncharacterized protein AB675_10490 [Cyphellophora attinorum]|uniref:Kinesin motor domain-containing protein n=1 Tax=Cyphellophora attinorum TaxID=1664694 RepID=A0A0N1GYL0_9EURO|nr:uncharacterized protein AB675_10490 [Phialophora attinorum]KPI35893.1 hypothetical protein AB675_10490 [Phialophora attinorum]
MSGSTSLFQVYLRLRPPIQVAKDPTNPWLIVEQPDAKDNPGTDGDEGASMPFSTHVTLQPPNESRKRAIERFGFTKIFREDASQLDVFEEIKVADSVRSVVQSGRDGLIATLGVTGSGKSHTILGSKSQRGLTQMTLDVLFNSLGHNVRRPTDSHLISSIQATDASEAQIQSATTFLESIYGDSDRSRISRTPMSRAQTPMTVNSPIAPPGAFPSSPSRDSLSREMQSLALSETYQAEVLKGYTLPDSPSPKKKDKWHPPPRFPFGNS